MARGSRRGGGGNSGDHRGDRDRGHHRRPYVSPYGGGVIYGGPGYGAFGWINPYPLGYSDTTDTDDSTASPNQVAGANDGSNDAQPEQSWPPAPRSPYPPASDFSQPTPGAESEEAVTLIFKDGRQPEQIHNYILTRATLFVGDKQRREIPTEQIDLAATAKVNQDAGVEFRLPDVLR